MHIIWSAGARVALVFLALVSCTGSEGSNIEAVASTHRALVTNAAIVIRQVHIHNSTTALKCDFVELFNRSSAPVNVWNYSVRARGKDPSWIGEFFLPALSLAPGQSLLIQQACSPGATLPVAPDLVDLSPFPSMQQASGGLLSVSIYNPGGVLEDTIGCRNVSGTAAANDDFEGTIVPLCQYANLALQRKDNGRQDTNDNAQDFQLMPASPRNTATTHPSVAIRQLYTHTSESTSKCDFIELFNPGASPAFLDGWYIKGEGGPAPWESGARWFGRTDLPAVTLAPGESLVVQEYCAPGHSVPSADVVDATPFAPMRVAAPTGGPVPKSTSIRVHRPDGGFADLLGCGVVQGWEREVFGDGPGGWSAMQCGGGDTSLQRKGNGFQDTNQNAADFVTAPVVVRGSDLCDENAQDPRLSAPAPDPTLLTTFASVAVPLYTGTNASQLGVVTGILDPSKLSVIQGRVLTHDGAPFTCAEVDVAGAPQYGKTYVWKDGSYALAVNGGGEVTVRVRSRSALSSQRTVSTIPGSFTQVSDIRLLPRQQGQLVCAETSPTCTPSSTGTVVVGAVETDTDEVNGVPRQLVRQAALFVAPGTRAFVPNDGGELELKEYAVSIQEFTNVNKYGREAMPGTLPALSGFTYAAALSVTGFEDQEVRFDKPIPVYVDNFLEFPNGETVPVGRYDERTRRWVTEPSGVVFSITGISNGKAQTSPELTDATPEELAALAVRYPVGKSLWRWVTTHFSAWDANWGFVPPDDAVPPPTPKPKRTKKPRCQKSGSIIECETQVLREEVPVPATPFTLVYSSGRQAGSSKQMRIPLSGSSVPSSLKRIDAEISIAGRRTAISATGGPSQSYDFEWDGLNAAGFRPNGPQQVSVRTNFIYQGRYARTTAFGRSPNGPAISGNRQRLELAFPASWSGLLGNIDAHYAGLGGWTLDVHHSLDLPTGTVYLGSGGEMSGEAYTITTLATLTNTVSSRDLELAADGTVYFADGTHVRRIDTNGTIHDVVSNAACGSSLCDLSRFAISADGTLYVIDNTNDAIKRFDPKTGALSVVLNVADPRSIAIALDGTMYVSGGTQPYRILRVRDGLVDALPGSISPTARAMRVARDGSLYLILGNVVHKYGLNGVLTRVAGGDSRCHYLYGDGGNGVPATQACLYDPASIAFGPSGDLYISDGYHHQVRRVNAAGIIERVIGTGKDGAFFPGDGRPPGATSVSPGAIAVSADGTIYFRDDTRIRRMAFGNTGGQTLRLGSADGSQLFVFNNDGRHVSTLDSHTGASIHTFGYTAGGLLSNVRDASNRLYTFRRDIAGQVDVVAPDGQVTVLKLDASNNLETITRPDASQYRFEYYPGSMLSKMWDPKGLAEGGMPYEFAYSKGRLISDRDPRPGAIPQTLSRSEGSNGWTVTHQSPKGYATQYVTDVLDRTERLAIRHPNQTTSVQTISADGILAFTASSSVPAAERSGYDIKLETPDGTKTYTRRLRPQSEPDDAHRPGAIAYPMPGASSASNASARLIELPSGLYRFEENSSEVSTNSLGVIIAETTTTKVNGIATSTTFDPATRTFTTLTGQLRKYYRVLDSLGRTSSIATDGLTPTTIQYDAAGRPVRIRRGSGSLERLAQTDYFPSSAGAKAGYVQRVLEKSAPATTPERTTTFEPDPLGRVLKSTLGTFDTYTTWDGNGNLTGVTPPGKPPHTLQWNPANLLDKYIPPGAGVATPTTTYTYDVPERSLLVETRPGGAALTWQYDTAGRRDKLTIPNGLVDYDYYGVAPAPGAAPGLLSLLRGPYGVDLGFEYDGTLTKKVSWSGQLAGSVAWSYNNRFLPIVESVQGAAGTAVPITFGYDNDNLLVCASTATCPAWGVAAGAEALQITRELQKGGLIQSVKLGGVTESFTYNTFGELATQTASHGTVSLSFTYDSATYPRDSLGRIKRKTESTATGSSTTTTAHDYVYDAGGRLTNVKVGAAVLEHFKYDANGNRISDLPNDTVNATYDDQDRLKTYDGWTYSYTANGELATRSRSGESWTYTYDVLGNLTAVVTPSATIDYVVDGLGRRVGKKKNGVLVKQWLYRNELSPVAELDGAGNVVARFVYGTRSNTPDFVVRGGYTYRLISDHLGSPRYAVRMNLDSEVPFRASYSAFGKRTLQAGAADWIPFGFAGGLFDPDTGLVRFGARDYDPTVGRWASKDPIRFDGGVNLYVYVENDPVNLIDPWGLVGCGDGECFSRCMDAQGVDWLFGALGLSSPFMSIPKVGRDAAVAARMGASGFTSATSWLARGLKAAGATGAGNALRAAGARLNPYANLAAVGSSSYIATSAAICAIECAGGG